MKRLALLLVLSAGISLDSHAQFGDFLKSVASDAARQAVSGQLTKAVNGAVDSAVKGIAQPNGAPAPAADAGARPATPGCPRIRKTPIVIGARPESYQPESLWPDAGCPVASYADLKFAKASAAKQAFIKASEVRCSDCEGGYWPEAWNWRELVKGSSNYGRDFTKLLVALKEGESLKWKGSRYEARVTAAGAHPIGELPCRQFHYVLTEQGRQVAQYDSVYCEYAGGYSASASWQEMI